MNKTQAKAVLAFSRAVLKAAEVCENRLIAAEAAAGAHEVMLDNARAYWLGHTRSIAGGYGYGSAPVVKAEEALE